MTRETTANARGLMGSPRFRVRSLMAAVLVVALNFALGAALRRSGARGGARYAGVVFVVGLYDVLLFCVVLAAARLARGEVLTQRMPRSVNLAVCAVLIGVFVGLPVWWAIHILVVGALP